MSTRIGELLETAGLVSSAQIEVAIRDQTQFPDKRLGEILALRGWVQAETVEFFLYLWPQFLNQPKHYPLGYYLTASGLLKEDQIKMLLKEQEKTGVKLGALAVLHGWLKQDTITFFLKGLNPQALAESAFVRKHPPITAQAHPAEMPTAQPQPTRPSDRDQTTQTLSLDDEDLEIDVAWIG